jgi:hypothetical protein
MLHKSDPGQTDLAIDITEAEHFLKHLDPEATKFTFQTFDDNAERKDGNLVKVLNGTLAQHATTLTRLNNRGAGIFVTINQTDLKGRKAENIVRVRAQFADLDGAPLEPVMAAKLPPHIVVETSPERWHLYWLVKDMALQDFSAVQQAIIERFHSDPTIHDLPRVMRLPGFFHRKRTPFLVRIISTTETPPYPASYFERQPTEPHISGDKEEASERDLLLVIGALQVIPPAMEWHNRNYIGMATWRATDGAREGFEAWCRWLERSGRFNYHAARQQWLRYSKSPPSKLGLGTLILFADEFDPTWREQCIEDVLREFWGIAS